MMSEVVSIHKNKANAAPRKVAIACQGGGTHAAFTWGVLTEILRTQAEWAGDSDGFEITGFSGTSAGALCALAAWYGLAPNDADTDCGTPEKAIERLDFLWHTFAATTPAEIWHNWVIQTGMEWKTAGVPSSPISPNSPQVALSLEGLKMLGVRSEYLGFDALLEALCPDFDHIDWPALAATPRRIIAGALEVFSGNFEIFDSQRNLENLGLLETAGKDEKSRWRVRRPLSLAGVAASGTLPEVQPARRISNTEFPSADPDVTIRRDALYWDGLYSQNPPVRDLLDKSMAKEQKPDEIWVVRINPQELLPTPMTEPEEIEDRRNELAGNVSLNQELDHIMTVTDWLTKHRELSTIRPFDKMKKVTVRTIKMRSERAYGLRYASKLDRSKSHYETLAQEGREVAAKWLADWRDQGDDFPSYPGDARYAPTEAAVAPSTLEVASDK